MLNLTPAASEAVRMLVHATPVDDDTGGLRIGHAAATSDGMGFDMAIVNAPQADDEEVSSRGALVFLTPLVAEFLDGRTLHAQFETGHVRFLVVDQPAS
jgi:Fe-S cluster assembly iron-binding protein IscA